MGVIMGITKRFIAILTATVLVVGLVPHAPGFSLAEALDRDALTSSPLVEHFEEGNTPDDDTSAADPSAQSITDGGTPGNFVLEESQEDEGWAAPDEADEANQPIQPNQADTLDEATSETATDESATDESALIVTKEAATIEPQDLQSSDYIEGEVIVVFNEDQQAQEAVEILEEVEAVDEDSITTDAMISSDTAIVSVSDDSTVAEAIAELNESPDVAYAQPNYLYYLCQDDEPEVMLEDAALGELALEPLANPFDSPGDPGRINQWGLTTTKLYDAWRLAQPWLGAKPRVSIAIIDTGVRTTHQDLAANIYPGSYHDTTPEKATDGDAQGHGTHVAGIAAAVTNNGVGASGVSYNAYIVPIKVFYRNDQGSWISSTSQLISAYQHLFTVRSNGKTLAQTYNLKVINMSIGGTSDDSAVSAWVTAAYNAGVLSVAAAGNSSTSIPTYPAAYGNCISVTALKQGTGTLNDVFDSSYSNFGKTVTLSAPGTNIYSTTRASDTSYGYMQGTSMASPFVAGAAALVFAANPSATPASVRAALVNTAKDLGTPGWDQYYGSGEVNPQSALLYNAVTGIQHSTPRGIGFPINCQVKTTLPGALSWNWSVSGPGGSISPTGVFTPSRNGIFTVRATSGIDSSISKTVTIFVPAPTVTLSASSFTYTGSAIRPAVTVKNGPTTLVQGVDYTVSYAHNINAGSHATVTVKGTGTGSINWTATTTTGFTIKPASISSSKITVSPIASLAYTGAHRTPKPVVSFNGSQRLSEGSHYQLSYSNNVNISNTARVIIKGTGNFTGERTVNFKITGIKLTTAVFTQATGWMKPVDNGARAGTPAQRRGIEALRINLVNNTGVSGGITYSAYVQGTGWQDAKRVTPSGLAATTNQGQVAGTTTKKLRLEAFRIQLTGDLAKRYSVHYRAYVQGHGWLNWAKDGQRIAGSTGAGLRVEAIQVYLALKTAPAPAKTFMGITSMSNSTVITKPQPREVRFDGMVHVQSLGDIKFSNKGGTYKVGTSGRALRMEAIRLQLNNQPLTGGISYSTHIQSIGWQSAVSNGALSGTKGRALRLEAVRIKLTGNMANHYDVYYRVHAQNFGWTGWASNGQSCGTEGYAYRLEALQIKIVPKDTAAPGTTKGRFYKK